MVKIRNHLLPIVRKDIYIMKKSWQSLLSFCLCLMLVFSVFPISSSSAGNYPSITLDVPWYSMRHASGCGIASIAMVEGFYKGYGDNNQTCYDAVYNANGKSVFLASYANLGYTTISNDLEQIYNHLKNNEPVIVYRTGNQHYSVIYGYNGSTTTLTKSGFKVKNTYHASGNYDPISWETAVRQGFDTNLDSWLSGNTWRHTLVRTTDKIKLPAYNHPEHNYTLQYYQEAHPHYGFYKCSCGASYNNTSVTRNDPTCSICNPGKTYRIVNGVFPSNTIEYKKDFTISGTLYSTANIRWVIGTIIDAKTGEHLQSNSGKWPYTKSYDLSDLNDQLDFSVLPSGDYYFMLQANAADCPDMDVVWRPFTVPELFSSENIVLPDDVLILGTDFDLSGTILCQKSISWVNLTIINTADSSTVFKTPSIIPQTNSFNISELNSVIDFGTLEAGEYECILKAGSYQMGDMNNIYSFFTVVDNTDYALIYDANGGENTPDGQIGNGSVTLSDERPNRSGYSFLGWSTSANATEAQYAPGAAFYLTDNTTLYAVWKANTYSVRFFGNGATSGNIYSQTFTYDVAQNLTANTYERVYTVTYHYNGATGGNSASTAAATATFNGWATSAGGAKVYENRQSVRNLVTSGTFDLYANWTLGSITLPTPIRTGYYFDGWFTDSALTAAAGAAGSSYKPTENVTLYAKWTAITVTDISVKTMPSKTTYTIGESFDQSGLTLTANYSDGSMKTITSGYSCTGFDSATAGSKTITVTYEGKTTSFAVIVSEKPADPTIKIHNFVPFRAEEYRTTITFSVAEDDIQNPVEGAQIHWIVNGQDKHTGDTYTVEDARSTYIVQVQYIKDGKILAVSETETVNIQTGFFAKLKAFFRGLFGLLPKTAQEYLGIEFIDRVLP